MKRSLLFVGLTMLLFSLKGKSQDNLIKLNLASTIFTKISLNYEKVVNDKQSFSIYLGFKIPRSVKFKYLNEDGETDSKIKVSGYSVSPEYRFYTSSKKDAPAGFYLAPYLKYSHSKYSMKGVISTETEETDNGSVVVEHEGELDGFWNCFGGGLQLGYQWVINDKISIDFAFFGIGVDRNVLGAKITPNNKSVNLQELADDIDSSAGTIPIIGAKIKANAEDDKVVVKAPFIFPGVRGAISIGFMF